MTVNCQERGLLLLRVRDEIRMTLAAYQSLYESSIAFGMRKALMAEQRKSELQTRVSVMAVCVVHPLPTTAVGKCVSPSRCGCVRTGGGLSQVKILTAEVSELEKTVDQLNAKCEDLEASEKERFAAEEEKHAAEVAKLKVVNDQLKESLEAVLAPPTSAAKKAGAVA